MGNQKQNRKNSSGRRSFKKSTKPPRNVVGFANPLFPPLLRKTLKYTDQNTISAGAGVQNNYYFRLNSLYDPDGTGIGVYPYGYTLMSSAYSRYRVLSATVIYRITNYSTSDEVRVGFLPTIISTNVGTSPEIAAGQPYGAYRILGPSSGSHEVLEYRTRVQLHKIAGVSPQYYRGAPEYSALFGANPSTTVFFYLTLQSAVAWSVRIAVEIQFDTEFYFPIPLIN